MLPKGWLGLLLVRLTAGVSCCSGVPKRVCSERAAGMPLIGGELRWAEKTKTRETRKRLWLTDLGVGIDFGVSKCEWVCRHEIVRALQ